MAENKYFIEEKDGVRTYRIYSFIKKDDLTIKVRGELSENNVEEQLKEAEKGLDNKVDVVSM